MVRLYMTAAALVLMTGPALAQSSWPTTLGSTPAPALGVPLIVPAIPRTITLGIAAAATANDHTVTSPASVIESEARVATNAPAVPLRSSTR